MKWILQSSTETTRLYENDKTNTTIQTDLIYRDNMDNAWWGFHDLFSIPYIRIAYSKTISDLFRVGISIDDLKTWIKKEKELLRSAKADPEQYEKLYSLVLEKEAQIEAVVNPLHQHLALCTIYVLAQDERIDYFDNSMINPKLDQWKLDQDAASFFLTWHTAHIANYMKGLNKLSQIVLSDPVMQTPGL